MKETDELVPLSRKIRNVNRMSHAMSGKAILSKDLLTAWEQDAESLERTVNRQAEQLFARRTVDHWQASGKMMNTRRIDVGQDDEGTIVILVALERDIVVADAPNYQKLADALCPGWRGQ